MDPVVSQATAARFVYPQPIRFLRVEFGKHRNGENVLSSAGRSGLVERTYGLQKGEIHLGPPIVTKPDGSMTIGALDAYRIVALDRFTVLVVDTGARDEKERPITGYRVATAEPWFWAREACESYSRAPPSRPAGSFLRSTYQGT